METTPVPCDKSTEYKARRSAGPPSSGFQPVALGAGPHNHCASSLWLTAGFNGSAGGEWGQRIGAQHFLGKLNADNIHILLHEMGHTYGPDDWNPLNGQGFRAALLRALRAARGSGQVAVTEAFQFRIDQTLPVASRQLSFALTIGSLRRGVAGAVRSPARFCGSG